jgi:hypothetical protein
MPVYPNSDKLYRALKTLFSRIPQENPDAAQTLQKSKLIMRMRTSSPVTEITFNGRHNPLQIIYGPSSLKSDVEMEIQSDLLHEILLSTIPLRKAYTSGRMKVRGAVWKAVVLESILRAGQDIYPKIYQEQSQENPH